MTVSQSYLLRAMNNCSCFHFPCAGSPQERAASSPPSGRLHTAEAAGGRFHRGSPSGTWQQWHIEYPLTIVTIVIVLLVVEYHKYKNVTPFSEIKHGNWISISVYIRIYLHILWLYHWPLKTNGWKISIGNYSADRIDSITNLAGGLEHFFCFHIAGIMIPTD